MRKVEGDRRSRRPVEEWLTRAPGSRSLAEVASLLRAAAGGPSSTVEAEEAERVAEVLLGGDLSARDLARLCSDGDLRRRVASVACLLAVSESADESAGRASWLGRRWLGVAALLAACVSGLLLAPYLLGPRTDLTDHRAGTIEIADVQVIGPQGALSAAPLIEWKPVLGADLYEVEVTTADGRMIFLDSTPGTELQVPSDILERGARYFYRVRARVEVSRWISSDFREFLVR